ncbi:RteC domain-containing protein [Formosa haliotis]|uniref:RteC domain-containing protein n=1 Tax=Formosa haliotis TaxID=1555194 RepID=UPI000824C70B|nr:RteC domain-containing protein [Formosa haliotis]
MDSNYQHVVEGFKIKLEELNYSNITSLGTANQGILLCNDALYHLKKKVERHGFKSVDEEIYFFKQIKVVPLSFLVYFSEVRSCQLKMPKLGKQNKLTFLNKRMCRVNKFFKRHCDFVDYMDQELNYLDKQYFTRSYQVFPKYALPESAYLDPKFFTSHDMLWARIKGMDEFVFYIQNIRRAIEEQEAAYLPQNKIHKPLQWTSSKIALIELIYALHESKVINHGNEDLKSLASIFEHLFDLPLDNIYKTYAEIKARKGLRARFLEELIQRFNYKMDRDDAL